MNILAWVHLYPPDHNAGAELMLHEILIRLKARGHTCRVICDASSAPEFEGIPIYPNPKNISDLIEGADVVITHLDRTRIVIRTVGDRKPIVHLIHNDKQLRFHRVRPKDASLVVANSEWIRKAIRWPGRTIVVPPPVDPKRYETDSDARSRNSITLINLHENKGAHTFWQLARIFPERQFVAVKGGYGEQVIPERIPENVVVKENSPDIKRIYSVTRLLLIPSAYESYGRVGIEAAASGIPSIAHPTPGLLESLSTSGTFVDRADIAGWVEAIRSLDYAPLYAEKSKAARARSLELEPTASIDLLEAELKRLVP